jgi:hypothetical protein
MPTPEERFLVETTATLSDNAEMWLAARHGLQQRLEMSEGRGGDGLETMAGRMETAERIPWRVILFVAALLVTVAAAVLIAPLVRSMTALRWNHFLGMPIFEAAAADDWITRRVSPEDRFLLLGDPATNDPVERAQSLVERFPDDAGAFAFKALTLQSEGGGLPPDFVETGRRLDPGNGWYEAMAAVALAEEAVDQLAKRVESPAGVSYRPVADEGKLDEALAMLRDAAGRPEFRSPDDELWERRMAVMPEVESLTDRVLTAIYSGYRPFGIFRIQHLGAAMKAKAYRLAEAGDVAGLRELEETWRNSGRRLIGKENPNVLEMLVGTNYLGNAQALDEAYGMVGEAGDAARLQEVADRLEARKQALNAVPDSERFTAGRGSMVWDSILPMLAKQTLDPPPLEMAELRPGRLADHAFLGWVGGVAGWLILGVAALAAWLYRWRMGMIHRHVSARLMRLLTAPDWMWILAAGVGLPIAFHQFIQRFTVASAREWSVTATSAWEVLGQQIGLLVLMILGPLVVARWRLSLRMGRIGFRSVWWIWTAVVVIGVISIVMWGFTFSEEGRNESASQRAIGVTGLSVLSLVGIILTALLAPARAVLQWSVLARCMQPVCVFGMLVMAASVPLHLAEERYWTLRDDLSKTHASGWVHYELEVAKSIQRDLLEILDAVDPERRGALDLTPAPKE